MTLEERPRLSAAPVETAASRGDGGDPTTRVSPATGRRTLPEPAGGDDAAASYVVQSIGVPRKLQGRARPMLPPPPPPAAPSDPSPPSESGVWGEPVPLVTAPRPRPLPPPLPMERDRTREAEGGLAPTTMAATAAALAKLMLRRDCRSPPLSPEVGDGMKCGSKSPPPTPPPPPVVPPATSAESRCNVVAVCLRIVASVAAVMDDQTPPRAAAVPPDDGWSKPSPAL